MPLRILIADDSATNRLLFATTITRTGHHADVVATGREAVNLFMQNRYDLVFLDINMPVMGGIATAREIQTINKTHTPVYAISGWIDADLADQMLLSGVRDCLVKPLDRDKLNAVIHACGLENQDADLPPTPPVAAPQDIPQKLLGTYAQELRSRADACTRYVEADDLSALLREAHTLRALADMLKTPEVEKNAGIVEKEAHALLRTGAADTAKPALQISALVRACHLAARAIERMI